MTPRERRYLSYKRLQKLNAWLRRPDAPVRGVPALFPNINGNPIEGFPHLNPIRHDGSEVFPSKTIVSVTVTKPNGEETNLTGSVAISPQGVSLGNILITGDMTIQEVAKQIEGHYEYRIDGKTINIGKPIVPIITSITAVEWHCP